MVAVVAIAVGRVRGEPHIGQRVVPADEERGRRIIAADRTVDVPTILIAHGAEGADSRPSCPPLARVRPSGLNATVSTKLVCPVNGGDQAVGRSGNYCIGGLILWHSMQVREFSGEELEHVAREGVMPVIARTGPGFRGRMTQQGLGDAVMLNRVRSGGAMQTLRTDRMAGSTTGNDLVIFCVHVAGSGYVRQHDRFAELRTGTAVMYEARSRWKMVTPGGSQSLAIHFSRDLLPMRTNEITESCARALDPWSPAMRVLAGYLKRLDSLAGDLNAEQRSDAGRAAIDLLVMALRDVTPAAPDGSAPVLLEMLRAYVRDHLADAALSVDELARRHHVSARHVYTVFQDSGTTPGAFIRAERLRAARSLLADLRFAGLAVSRIAAMTGFADPRTFERAFRREFGSTPGAWRHEH